jgi:hypothetical protein
LENTVESEKMGDHMEMAAGRFFWRFMEWAPILEFRKSISNGQAYYTPLPKIRK